jgi:charged multivesicular body protein 5
MHRIFGRAKPVPEAAPAPDLNAHLSTLTQRTADMSAKIAACDKQLIEIKTQLTKCRIPAQQASLKQRALQILKKKKTYEGMLSGTEARQMNLEQMTYAIDMAKEVKDTVAVMKATSGTLRTEIGAMDFGELEDLQDDMSDMMADANEINELLSRPYDSYNDVDEADLDAALEGLEAEVAMGEISGVEAPEATVAEAPAPAAPAYVPALPTAGSAPLPSRPMIPAAGLATAPAISFK